MKIHTFHMRLNFTAIKNNIEQTDKQPHVRLFVIIYGVFRLYDAEYYLWHLPRMAH